MEELYVLYSLRMNAWVSPTGTGTSVISDAKKFGGSAAYTYCKKAMGNDGGLVLFPVTVESLRNLGVKL